MALRALLLALFLIALSGCLGDDDAEPDDAMEDDGAIAAGAPLGDSTFSEGGTLIGGVQVPDPTTLGGGCDTLPTASASHTWTIPDANEDGVPWRSTGWVVSLTSDAPYPSDLDIFIFDANGDPAGESTNFDILDGAPVPVSGNAASPLTIEVHACTGANVPYTLTGSASMVAR